MNIQEIFATVIGLIITIYVAFIIISQFSQQTPEFGYYGWLIFGALIFGVIVFFKYNLLPK